MMHTNEGPVSMPILQVQAYFLLILLGLKSYNVLVGKIIDFSQACMP